MSKVTLTKLCILNIAQLLKKCYWSGTTWFEEKGLSENPFSSFPSHIIEDIIASVVELSPKGKLCEKDLRPVLSSNRINYFELHDVLIQTKELLNILTLLSNYSGHLTSLVLYKIHCTDCFADIFSTPTSTLSEDKLMRSRAVENLLASAVNLDYLHIDVPFDLNVLKLNKELKQLEIDFVPTNDLADIIPESQNEATISKIKSLSIFEGPRYTFPKEQIAFLLQHCPNLVWFGNSIAEALELIHGEEIASGVVMKTYKLERIILGNAFLDPDRAPAAPKAVQIASVTCPYVTELDLLINTHEAILALSKMHSLKSLLLQWAHVLPGDFCQGLLLALQDIGIHLNNLNILNFGSVDFAAIATFCPNLSFLKLELESEFPTYDPPDVCFQSLEVLLIECMGNVGLYEGTLILLLSHCNNLETLCLDNVPCLTDSLLCKVLAKNSLSKLAVATLIGCSLTENGLRQLVTNCKSLEFLDFSSELLSLEEAVIIVQEIRPSITMRYFEG